MIRTVVIRTLALLGFGLLLPAQEIPLQPLAQQVRLLDTALTYLGQPLLAADQKEINDAVGDPDEAEAAARLQRVLDKYTLAVVEINAEGRVKVDPGAAKPELVEGGARLFLVKVLNRAHVRSALRVQSPNAGDVYIRSNGSAEPELALNDRDSKERWAAISFYERAPMRHNLSGLGVEYKVLEIHSRDAGQRSAVLQFDTGETTRDLGFRSEVMVVFTAAPARVIPLRIRDENGKPAVASILIKDRQLRIYPNQAKRLAPDFFFQPQVYRADGETIALPAGYYTVTYTAGPEYIAHTREFTVDATSPAEISLQLERWIDPSKRGWYSGDHHVHAAGCSHYQNPTEGVLPKDMVRQLLGEALNVGAVLTWGPCYYYQKQFFTGEDDTLSKVDRIMHYDLEVSGFPSSHAGHIVLLGLKDQDYPGTKRIEDWPTWDLPIFQWAKQQGAIAGFAHSGWGLTIDTAALPSYQVPPFDGIGANEYIVDVTHPGAVDFISAVDTPYPYELNIWYHTLNVGFQTRISGETDFPCIYDSRVGIGRTYAKIDGTLSYPAFLDSLRDGRSYVSDGKSHLMDFRVQMDKGQAHVTVNAAAYLGATPNEAIRSAPPTQQPYWDVERARIGNTREVPVELIVNGQAVARREIVADGKLQPLVFDVRVTRSSWIAVRILPSSHTNPYFAIVDNQPIRASRRSAEWCLAAVNQCWSQKSVAIAPKERAAAVKAYDHAREVYRRLIAESPEP